MLKFQIKIPPNFDSKIRSILIAASNMINKKLLSNLGKAAEYLRDRVREGYANSKAYGITTVSKRAKAHKIGRNRYHKSGGRTSALKRTGDMMRSVVVKRMTMKRGFEGNSNMSISVGFRNSKYNKISSYHAKGTGKWPEKRDIWRAVYNKHRKELVKIILKGI